MGDTSNRFELSQTGSSQNMAVKNAALEGQEFEEVIVPDGSTEGDVDPKDREAFR